MKGEQTEAAIPSRVVCPDGQSATPAHELTIPEETALEITALYEFFFWAMGIAFEGHDIDGGSLQDKALALSLCTEVEATVPCDSKRCGCEAAGLEFPIQCIRFSKTLMPLYKHWASLKGH